MPATLDISAYRGDTYTNVVTVVNAAGNPLTLPGTVRGQVRATVRGSVLASFTVEKSANTITLTVPAAQMRVLTSGVYDVEHTNAGVVTTILKGRFTVEEDVTRD